MFTPLCHAAIEGHIEQTDVKNQELDKKLFTGEVEKLEQEDVIKMTVSQVLSSGYTQEGDEFFAEVSEDVSSEKGIIIPKGSIAHGKVQYMQEAKNMGRDGYIVMDFDYLVTPDGRQIPIQASVSTRENLAKGTAKAIGEHVGYTLAGGAAIGGAIGLGMALIRKGHDVLIAPGDQIRVKINTSVPLPVYKETALMQHELFYPGLDIHISDIKHEKDPFGEVNTITLTVMISNMSDKTFSGLDMALVNDYNSVFRPSIFGDTKLMFKQIRPGDKFAGSVSFAVDNIDRSFWLTFYDRRKGTALSKISLDNAYRKVSDKTKKKNQKLRKRKTNFKKEEDLFDVQ